MFSTRLSMQPATLAKSPIPSTSYATGRTDSLGFEMGIDEDLASRDRAGNGSHSDVQRLRPRAGSEDLEPGREDGIDDGDSLVRISCLAAEGDV